MTATTNRLHGLDFLRALMMSLGVVLHTAQIYLTIPIVDYYWDTARSPSMDFVLVFINTFRMPVFYLLSGFFTALLLDKRGSDAMLRNRYLRIVLPFLVFWPLLALIMTCLHIVALHVMETGTFGFDTALIAAPWKLLDKTHNLWFLYYLVLHVLTVWLGIRVWRVAPAVVQQWCKRMFLGRPIYSGALFIGACLALAALGSTSSAGRLSADLSFLPSVSVYLYFGLCFLLGWLLYWRMQDLEALALAWKKYLAIATTLFVIALGLFVTKGEPGVGGYLIQHALLSVTTGFSIGYYMTGFVGLFSAHFQSHNAWVRYFSDSAYWIFIFHSVPLVAIALLLHSWQVPAEIKFSVVCVGTLVICLWTYQRFVRNGKMGALLNGRRYTATPWRD